MQIIIMPTADKAAEITAKIIADEINNKPAYKLGLATGRTMEAVYAKLAEMNKAGKVDFSLVRSFNLDEYIGLSKDDVNSYHYYMNYHLFDKINIDKRNTHVPEGDAEDIDEIADLWREREKLGCDEAEFIGYWKVDCPVVSKTPGVYASCYVRKDNSVVAIVSNLTEQRKVVELSSRKEGLAMPAPFELDSQDFRFIEVGK